MKRVALVGAGFISQVHAEAVAALPDAELNAVVDPNTGTAERLARRWHIPNVYSSVEELIASDAFECAHVLVPPDLHYRTALPILRAGKSVLLEKPLATSSEDCRSLLAAASPKAILGVNQNFVYHPAFVRLRAALQRRALGKPKFVSCLYNVPLRQLATGQLSHWMFRAPGNILLEQAVHPLSQIVALAGNIQGSEVSPGPAIELSPGVMFYSTMSLSIQGHRMSGQLWFAVGQPFPFWQITAICDDGVIVADILSNRTFSMTRTRWSEGIDRFLSGHRAAADILRSSWLDFGRYGLEMLGFKNYASPFSQSIKTSVAEFYRAIDSGVEPELDGRFGAGLVSVCESAREHFPDTDISPSAARNASAASEPSAAKASGVAMHPVSGSDVAVLGGTGFIGTHVVENLLARGLRVTVMARHPINLPAVFYRDEVALRRGDIRNARDIAEAVGSSKYVINLAHGGGGGTWEDIRKGMVGGAENIAKACQEKGVQRLIHVGSIASLYLGPEAGIITGSTLPDPETDSRADYARAKAMADRLVLDLHERQGLPVVLLRPGLVVGKGTSPFHSGVGFYNNEQHCVGWNRGNNPLPFVLVSDVAEAIAESLTADNVIGRSFNLIGDVRPTARTYIAELARALERPLRFHGKAPRVLWSEELMKWGIKRVAGRHVPIPSYRDLLSRGLVAEFDCSDAKQALNWSPAASADEFWKQAVYIHATL